MPVYPINLELAGKSCACIGGGAVAERKILALLEAGASVTVFSPDLTPTLAKLIGEKKLIHIAKAYQPGDIGDFFMVICATDSASVNQAAALEAKEKKALVNVVDNPGLCDFSVPSKVIRGDLLMTVSTGGKSPALAKMLRHELEEHYGPEYGLYLDIVSRLRAEMKERLATSKEREQFWRERLDSQILELLQQGKLIEAEEKIRNATGCTRPKS